MDASLEVRGPIVYATLIIVAATVPIFFLDGLTGAFFRPLAISYTLAVMASMLVALTVTPALAYIFLRNAKLEDRDPPLVRVLKRLVRRRSAAHRAPAGARVPSVGRHGRCGHRGGTRSWGNRCCRPSRNATS